MVGNVAFSKLAKMVSLAVAIARSKKVKRELPNSNQLAKPLWNLLANNRKVVYKYTKCIYTKNVT